MHNVQRKFKNFDKNEIQLELWKQLQCVENKMYGFDEMTHIGMKRKLFG